MKSLLFYLLFLLINFALSSYAGRAFSYTQHFYAKPEDAIIALNSTNYSYTMDAYYSLFDQKIYAIPYLLNNSDATNDIFCFAHWSSHCSFIPPFKNTGILSLYLIECILHNKTQPHYNAWILKLNITEEGKHTYIKANDYTTQTNVASIYKSWWERNKNYSLAEIRERDINPLAHSHYQWQGYTQYMNLAEFTFTNKTVIPDEYNIPKIEKAY